MRSALRSSLPSTIRFSRLAATLLVVSTFMSACSDATTGPRIVTVTLSAALHTPTTSASVSASARPSLSRSAGISALQPSFSTAPDFSVITGVTVTVTGPGISSPLVFALGAPDANGVTTASTVAIPAGPDRVFTTKAFVGSVLAYQGSDTMAVDTNLTATLYLAKVVNTAGLTTQMQDFSLVIAQGAAFDTAVATATLPHGTKTTFSVKVTYATTGRTYRKGDPVPNVLVAWATDNPGIATVAPTTCTTATDGTCTTSVWIVGTTKAGATVNLLANYAGVASAVAINTK